MSEEYFIDDQGHYLYIFVKDPIFDRRYVCIYEKTEMMIPLRKMHIYWSRKPEGSYEDFPNMLTEKDIFTIKLTKKLPINN